MNKPFFSISPANAFYSFSLKARDNNPLINSGKLIQKGILTEQRAQFNGSSHGTTRLYNDNGKLKQTAIIILENFYL